MESTHSRCSVVATGPVELPGVRKHKVGELVALFL